MDAVRFLRERTRMCKSLNGCVECELQKACVCYTHNTKEKAEKAVAIVEKWAKEHPKTSRARELLKKYPNVTINIKDNLPILYPCDVDSTLRGGSMCSEGCSECRKRYWTEEV